MKFFKRTAREIAMTDPFLRELLPNCRENSGVFTFDTLKTVKLMAAQKNSLAATPAEFLTNLNVCGSLHFFSVDRDAFGYLLEVKPNDKLDTLVDEWKVLL